MGKIKVLLVDDHPLVREGLRAILSSASDIKVVEEAADGFEAIKKASQFKPDVVLMDLRMPRMDGLEAIRRIKSDLPSTSVIVLTAYDNEAYIVSAIRAGAGGYLLKDASKALLIHTIRAVNSGGIIIKSCLLRQVISSLDNVPVKELRERSADQKVELTPRECQVLRLLARGQTNKEIGRSLLISEDTAKKHVQSIIQKLGVSDRTQAVVKAIQLGLLKVDR